MNFNRGRLIKRVYNLLFIIICIFWGFFACNFIVSSIERAYFYPLKYKTEIYEKADSFELDRKLVFAIVKIESGFNPNAESSKGAKGLMQITDGTANYIAEILGYGEYDIFEPSLNLEFGCFYLSYLLNKFKNIDTAVIAYNAGEGNVSAWLTDLHYSDDGKILRNTPFNETNDYIKKFRKSFEKYDELYPHILDK